MEKWHFIWSRYLKNYLYSSPRHGIVVEYLCNKYCIGFGSCLETGCGSARDSKYLSIKGFDSYALDFAKTPLYAAKNIDKNGFTDNSHILGDVFHLPFKDKSFDVSFNSGLLIYFKNKKSIFHILLEQKRVTSKIMIIFVHNKFNIYSQLRFNYLYNIKGKELYNIKRFTLKEIKNICSNLGTILEVSAYHFTLPPGVGKIYELLTRKQFIPSTILDKSKISRITKVLYSPFEICVVVDVRESL